MGADQKITVCHLASGDLWAGAEVQTYNMLSALAAMPELDLSAIILNPGKLADKIGELGLDVTVFDESRHGFSEIIGLVTKHLADRRVDIMHTHRYKENIIGARMKKAGLVCYLVQTVHGLPEPFTGLRRLKAALYGWLNRRQTRRYYDHIQAVSSDIKRLVSPWYGEGKISVVHNSIRLDDIMVRRTPEEVRAEFGIDPGQPVIGSVGRLVAVKGYEYFLQAARTMLAEKPDMKFILVGDGPMREVLGRQARDLGIAKAVIFTGYRPDPLDLISIFDLFVLSSLSEGIPTVALEAMALRKPVVATAVGGNPEVIDDGASGILVPPRDPGALAAACLRLLADDRRRQGIVEIAEDALHKKFTSEIQGRRVGSIYRSLKVT